MVYEYEYDHWSTFVCRRRCSSFFNSEIHRNRHHGVTGRRVTGEKKITETIWRTFIKKYESVEECLGMLEMYDPNAQEKSIAERAQRTQERLKDLICQIWHTNEFRTERPTPVDGETNRFVFSSSSSIFLWFQRRDGLWPWSKIRFGKRCRLFSRDIDQLLLETVGKRLPLRAAPIRFASWMGGDRDVSFFLSGRIFSSLSDFIRAIRTSQLRWPNVFFCWRVGKRWNCISAISNVLKDELSMINAS